MTPIPNIAFNQAGVARKIRRSTSGSVASRASSMVTCMTNIARPSRFHTSASIATHQ